MSVQPTSPVSFPVEVGRLPTKGLPVEIVADEKQRGLIAQRHDLPSVESFRAVLTVRRWKRDGVHVSGWVRAEITQHCVATLEPLSARIDTEVSALFVPESSPLARDEAEDGQFLVDPEAEDLPEPFSGNRIDVGQVAEEFFELAIDPYPRHPDSHDTAADMPAPPNVAHEDDAPEDGRGPMYEALRKLSRKD